MLKGKFISVEGSEGAGKSSAMRVIESHINKWSMQCVLTREPGGEENAEKIRNILLDSDHLQANTELLLMFAARSEHLDKVIRPALLAGNWVLSDRFVDASYAYQSGGRTIKTQVLDFLTEWIVAETMPDLTLLLDVDPKVGFTRISRRRGKDRIEKESIDFFTRIRSSYLERAEAFPDRIVVIDANQNQAKVHQDIQQALDEFKGQL